MRLIIRRFCRLQKQPSADSAAQAWPCLCRRKSKCDYVVVYVAFSQVSQSRPNRPATHYVDVLLTNKIPWNPVSRIRMAPFAHCHPFGDFGLFRCSLAPSTLTRCRL